MSAMKFILGVIGLTVLGSGHALAQDAPETPPMTFFLTSVGSGNGADLGTLAGADAHCQMFADGAGADDHTWRAYLSTQGPNAALLHESSRARTMPTDRILTGRCDTTLVGRGRSSD